MSVPDPLLPHDAGETQRAMHDRRAASTASRADRITDAISRRPGLTDYDLEEILGERHELVSGARNRLMRLGKITLKPDPAGKRHPLARTIDGRKVVVSTGPWEVKTGPDDATLLRWYLPEQVSRW